MLLFVLSNKRIAQITAKVNFAVASYSKTDKSVIAYTCQAFPLDSLRRAEKSNSKHWERAPTSVQCGGTFPLVRKCPKTSIPESASSNR